MFFINISVIKEFYKKNIVVKPYKIRDYVKSGKFLKEIVIICLTYNKYSDII